LSKCANRSKILNKGIKLKAKGQLIIVSAPSGAGKTSLVKKLVEVVNGLEVSVSHTTRAQRKEETPGLDYHFTTEIDFQNIIADNGFLEHAKVFDNYYGTSRDLVNKKLSEGVDVILEIDWQGAQQIRKVVADSYSIFILPPSKKILEQRLLGRGQDSEEVIARRMRDAVDEMSHYIEYNYLLVNDDFDLALEELIGVIKSKRLEMARSKVNNVDLIQQLLN